MSQDQLGHCANCGALNPYSSFDCRSCHTHLPWAAALSQKLIEGQNSTNDLSLQPRWVGNDALASVPPLVSSPLVSAPPAVQHLAATTAPRQAFCAHCGSPHGADAAFCSGCGTRILSANQDAPAPIKSQASLPWPFASQTAAPNGMPPHAYFSPQQNVSVNVVSHDAVQIKHKHKEGGFGRRMALLLLAGAAGLMMLGSLGPGFATVAAFTACVALVLRALW